MSNRPPVLLGVLRSEFDDTGTTSAEISEAVHLVNHVLDAWIHHRITAHTADALLHYAIWTTPDGVSYTIGATTRRWYRKDTSTSSWSVTPAPELVTDADRTAFVTTSRNMSAAIWSLTQPPA